MTETINSKLSKGYFHRVTELTPTRFWINNPTRDEAKKAISAGAISCTTNPTYSTKEILREPEYASKIIREAIQATSNDEEAADIIQQKLARQIMKIFLPIYRKSFGKEGFVSIQGSPISDDNTNHIIKESMKYQELGENMIAKIPATEAGLKAIEKLIAENMPIIATEIMAISQMIYTCELYERVSSETGNTPPFYITHITGIFDEYLKNKVEADNIDISEDVLWQAGCIVARKQYRLLKERKYKGTMLGGGARGLHHFTEMVGGDIHVTINWKGTADQLIESNPPVIYRINNPAPKHVIDDLLERIPDFSKAYLEDGDLHVKDYKSFGPVNLFRNSFVKGWNSLLEIVKDRR